MTTAETYEDRTRREREESRRVAERRAALEAIDGPSPEWLREARQEIDDMTITPTRPPLATSRDARAATPAPQIVKGDVVTGPPPAALKGAVKVDAFPEKCKYPFPEIARDGGIWQIDPAAFSVSPAAITQAAPKWAQRHGLDSKTVVDDGQVYVQFTRQQP